MSKIKPIISKIGRNIIDARWIYLILLYYVFYALKSNEAYKAYMLTHTTWSKEWQTFLYNNPKNNLIALMAVIAFGAAWNKRNKLYILLAMAWIIGLYIVSPHMVVYQIIFALLIIVGAFRIPAKASKVPTANTVNSVSE